MAKIFGLFDEKGLCLSRNQDVRDEVEQPEIVAVDVLAESA